MRSLGMAPACNVAALGGYSHADVTRITVTCGSHRLASERVSAVRSFSLAKPGRTAAKESRTGSFNLRQLSTTERIAATLGPAC